MVRPVIEQADQEGKKNEINNHEHGGSRAQNVSNRPFSTAVRPTTPHGDSLTTISQQVRHLRPFKNPRGLRK